ncbi:carboxylase [Streptomyces sp. NPDC058470]|uniref:carboxylase n=1 Tax=Streptomyces sp. NPDC058470 TaxID=3346515 RepID=UPI0036568D3C
MHTSQRRPVLLVGAGIREYHAHSLLQIAASHPVVLVDAVVPSWARPYLVGEVTVSLSDPSEVGAAVGRFTVEHPVSGIVTSEPRHAGLAAHLAQHLGLPGNSPSAVATCEDPSRAHRVLREADVPSMRVHAVDDIQSALAAARSLRFPVSLTAPAAGTGPVRADCDDEVRSAYVALAPGDSAEPLTASVTIEEFGLDGPEVGVEAVVLSPGEVQTVAVTRRTLCPERAHCPVGYSVDAHDELLQAADLTRVVAQATTALGLTVGVVHADVRLTSRGPFILQVGASPADDLIPLLVARARGIGLSRAAAALATGGTPDLTPTRGQAAAIRFLHPDASGRVVRLKAAERLTSQPWLDRFAWTQRPGKAVLGPPRSGRADRLAHWVVTGADTAECTSRLGLIAEQVTARVSKAASSPVGAH